MDELKNTIVSIEQGGINLDDSVNSIPDGDSRNTTNMMIYDNGVARGILGYEKVHTVTSGETIENACTDEDGNVYVLESTNSFCIYRNGTKIFETTDTLFDNTKYVQFESHDGYLFITQDGYEPLMISIQKNIDFISREYVEGFQNTPVDGKYIFSIAVNDWDNQFIVGDNASVVFDSNGVNQGGVNAQGEIVDIDVTLLYVNIKIEYVVKGDLPVNINGYLVYGLVDYFPFYENITTIKPTPQYAPSFNMVTDDLIGYNNFAEHNYTFGFTLVYDDNYETPMSPLSVVNLSSIEKAVKNRNGVTDLNKARIYIIPNIGTNKVKIYAKKDAESESFYLISTQDASPEILYDWDGSLAEDVLSNEEWVKGSESIPVYAKTMEYLSDDSLLYAGCTEGYEVGDIRIMAGFNQVDTDVSMSSSSSYAPSVTVIDDNNILVAFIPAMPWSVATESGKLYSSVTLTHSGSAQTSILSVSVDYSVDDTDSEILNAVIEEYNAKYGAYFTFTRYPNPSSDNIRLDAISTWGVTAATSSIEITPAVSVYSKSLKPDFEEQFGVVFKDRSGRSSGVVTNDACKLTVKRILFNNGISVWTPKIYLEGTVPSWASTYQFVVKRNLKSWGQYIIPCRETEGSWDTSSPIDSLAIQRYSNGVYGIALNKIVSDTQDGTANTMLYQYTEGDYLKFIRYYNSVDGWWNVFGEEIYRITGSREESGVTYYLIEDIENRFDNVFTAYKNSFNLYLQFEIVNVGSLSLTSNSIWVEIGEPYNVVGGNYSGEGSETTTYPIDGESYTFTTHNVDYGRCLIRPVYRGNLDLPETFKESYFYVESEYLFDSSRVKLLITGRPHTITKNEQVYRSIARVGGKKFDGTLIDNRRVFNYDDYATIGDTYGDVSGVIQRGNTIRVYCERGTGSIYLNADEVSYQDGTTNLVYSSNKLGRLRWSESGFGCSEHKHIKKANGVIYFFDKNKKEFLADTTGGIFSISGKSGERDYKVKAFFNVNDLSVGYDPLYRMVWVTTTQTMAFFEDYGRWKSFYSISPTLYFNHYNQLYSLNNYGVFKHHVDDYNSYNSLGVQSNADVVVELAVGADRQAVKNFEAVVQHSEDKYDVYLNCYTKNWDDDLYTKMPLGIFKKWEDLYYADVTKGGNESTFKSYMMYAGHDMVGKVGLFKVKGDVNVSALEVRYSVRNK